MTQADQRLYTVLGIETSCDETAAAVVRGHPDGARQILGNVVLSQLDAHRPYGGVVPEIAARAHVAHLDRIIAQAMEQSGAGWDGLNAIAATAGPGLIGGVMVGLTTGKAIAAARGIPLIAVNHLEGHALSARLIAPVPLPFLLLLVSGGHCQLLIVHGPGNYAKLGGAIDDAVGEAFDKTAKLLGLGYPGGPALEAAALGGDPGRFALPRPLLGRPGCDFSFSGLKTAVMHAVTAHGPREGQDTADLAASFQAAVSDVLCDRTAHAMTLYLARCGADAPRCLVVAGGVAANQALRLGLTDLCRKHDFRLLSPPAALCTDNAAMIAWAGIERLALDLTDSLGFSPRARWPLDPAGGAAR